MNSAHLSLYPTKSYVWAALETSEASFQNLY